MSPFKRFFVGIDKVGKRDMQACEGYVGPYLYIYSYSCMHVCMYVCMHACMHAFINSFRFCVCV